jgi:hypothetical protein
MPKKQKRGKQEVDWLALARYRYRLSRTAHSLSVVIAQVAMEESIKTKGLYHPGDAMVDLLSEVVVNMIMANEDARDDPDRIKCMIESLVDGIERALCNAQAARLDAEADAEAEAETD